MVYDFNISSSILFFVPFDCTNILLQESNQVTMHRATS
jgi:hypothetical protein